MEVEFKVQCGTVDEWIIRGILEGNPESKQLVVMVHGGGYDRDENGLYPVIENGVPKKENGKIKFMKKPYGNYQRLSYELQANELDCAILRIDLRNHGKSLVDGKMDERDTSFARFGRDIEDVIEQLMSKYNYESVNLVGTCAGALSVLYYLINAKDSNYISSVTLISPLSPFILSTMNKEHGFNYKKTKSILSGEVKQFTKMRGMFEGLTTIKESTDNYDMYDKIKDTYNILYIVSKEDRLIPFDISDKIINKLSIKPNFTSVILDKKEIRGNADHCFYDPQSSDALLKTTYTFLEKELNKRKKTK